MDREMKDYFEQRLLGVPTKSDIEKLRQEIHACFRQLQLRAEQEEEQKQTGWRQAVKSDLRELRTDLKAELDPLGQELRSQLRSFEERTQETLGLLKVEMESSVERMKQETGTVVDRSKQETQSSLTRTEEGILEAFDRAKGEMTRVLEVIREEIASDRSAAGEETETRIQHFMEVLNAFQEQIGQAVEEVARSGGRIRDGFVEIREELGAMMRFSFADLEKKISALEARIKALEKMVFDYSR